LTYKKALSNDEILYFTHVDGMKHFAIGAVVERADGRQEGVGIARFVRLANDPLAAEAALTVVDDYQDNGLGQLLLERLFSAAAERGLRELHFIVLPSNGPMLALVRKLQSGTKQALVARFEGGTVKHVIAVPSVLAAFK
jgi:ribosomal protein S18 acetylase RimI-like enzyme